MMKQTLTLTRALLVDGMVVTQPTQTGRRKQGEGKRRTAERGGFLCGDVQGWPPLTETTDAVGCTSGAGTGRAAEATNRAYRCPNVVAYL